MLLFNGCNEPTTPIEDTNLTDQQLEKEGKHYGSHGDIVVANRNSGSISVINTGTDEVSGTYQLPASPNSPEPMYVVFVKRNQRVFVGDELIIRWWFLIHRTTVLKLPLLLARVYSICGPIHKADSFGLIMTLIILRLLLICAHFRLLQPFRHRLIC